MEKLTLADLRKFRDQKRQELDRRDPTTKDAQIIVAMGTCGIAAGAREVLSTLTQCLDQEGVSNVTVRQSGCIGLCDREPMLTMIDKSGKEYRYGKLNSERIRTIVQKHVVGGSPVMEYLIGQ